MKIRSFDAFAGIGGFHIGLTEACKELGLQHECIMASEILEVCQDTYELNFKQRPLGDIWAIDPNDIPDFDILMGGFPCQCFSRNGLTYRKNGGTLSGKDKRENAVLSLLNILKVKKPKYLLFENVREVLKVKNVDGSLFVDTLMEALSELGYTVKYKILNSLDFGVPQQRYRVFFVGQLGSKEYEFPELDHSFPYLVPCIKDILLDDIGDPTEFLMKTYLGRLENLTLEDKNRFVSLIKAFAERKHKHPRERTGKISPLAVVYGDIATDKNQARQQDRLYSSWGISPTLSTSCAPAFDTKQGWRKLTPREAGRVQGYPDWYQFPEKPYLAYRQIGNSVSVPVVQTILQKLLNS